VTILAAINAGALGYYFFADGMEYVVDDLVGIKIFQSVEKFEHVDFENGRIIWGYAGSGNRGDIIRHRLAELRSPDWFEFKNVLGAALRGVNEGDGEPLAEVSVLVGGWLDEESELFAMDPASGFYESHCGVLFIEMNPGDVSGEWCSRHDSDEVDPYEFARFIESAVSSDQRPNYRLPIRIWHVASSGYERLEIGDGNLVPQDVAS
jgi:hypothetical protein